ncbi:CgeB family protein [Roseivivax isoporae]|uniref:Spore protein YkvP/CgeB glycosyl transferase-like domain-containing protein n=1 Tax=Roseivivax isoporae LMG 25204 TaxID=1449351 RepID=X7F8I6_9RHOB|nr:glycosyltransferase [Roseivivax isoporae]ETX29008.1 hypothetical protein RISW2_03440 [Roseivivax isoporae LMG 25204]
MTRLAFYGSSLLSSYWNGAATYYRGLLRALAQLGYDITFYEPDAMDRSRHRDMEEPDWARVVVYEATREGQRAAAAEAALADIVVKASGTGYEDDRLLRLVMDAARPGALRIFWDVDAPATLAHLARTPDAPLARLLAGLDVVLTYGGGDAVVSAYERLGAPACVPIYNALDPDTHFPVPPDPRFAADLAFLGNRLPDRDARVEEFFFGPARRRPELTFLLGGAGWADVDLPPNVRWIGHVPTADHNAFHGTPRMVLNIAREDMARTGFSPATRVFEATGAGGCLVTDAWEGIEMFFEPGREVLVAGDGAALCDILDDTPTHRNSGLRAAAHRRVLADHTYADRARKVHAILHARALTPESA